MRAAAALPSDDVRSRMDRMYRPQTRIYDLTRKYYLLGRDRLIAGLDAQAGETVLEIGCGTGRNLVMVGQLYPGVTLLGLDAAAPMLDVAGRALRRRGLDGRMRLARGVAERPDLLSQLGRTEPVDHVLLSYTLSMVDEPGLCLAAALAALRPGGRLHLVDFGDQAGMPRWFRRLLTSWLARFGVRHRPEVEATVAGWTDQNLGRLEQTALPGRYALLLRFTKAA